MDWLRWPVLSARWPRKPPRGAGLDTLSTECSPWVSSCTRSSLVDCFEFHSVLIAKVTHWGVTSYWEGLPLSAEPGCHLDRTAPGQRGCLEPVGPGNCYCSVLAFHFSGWEHSWHGLSGLDQVEHQLKDQVMQDQTPASWYFDIQTFNSSRYCSKELGRDCPIHPTLVLLSLMSSSEIIFISPSWDSQMIIGHRLAQKSRNPCLPVHKSGHLPSLIDYFAGQDLDLPAIACGRPPAYFCKHFSYWSQSFDCRYCYHYCTSLNCSRTPTTLLSLLTLSYRWVTILEMIVLDPLLISKCYFFIFSSLSTNYIQIFYL